MIEEIKNIQMVYSINELKIEIENLKKQVITPEGYNVINFKMKFLENTHTIVELGLKIKKEYIKEWNEIYNIEDNKVNDGETEITLLFGARKCFNGIIEKITIQESYSDNWEIKLLLKSKSIKLDRKKIYRVFQNPELTYYDLVKRILSDNEGAKCDILGVDLKKFKSEYLNELNDRIGVLIIQYNETDWEFLIRIMSHLGIAVINIENGGITLGFFKTIKPKIWDEKEGHLGVIIDRKTKYYTGISNELFISGDEVEGFEGKKLGYIASGEVYLTENAKLQGNYIIKPNDYTYPYIENKNIKGGTLNARVKRVNYTDLTTDGKALISVDFTEGLEDIVKRNNIRAMKTIYEKTAERKDNIKIASKDISTKRDENQKEKMGKYLFPYITPYSKTKTGFFCTPELNDKVTIYFPTTEEGDGFCIGALNNEMSIRFSNPFKRNYTTTLSEQIKLREIANDMNAEKIIEPFEKLAGDRLLTKAEKIDAISGADKKSGRKIEVDEDMLYSIMINNGNVDLIIKNTIKEKVNQHLKDIKELLQFNVNGEYSNYSLNKFVTVEEKQQDYSETKLESGLNREECYEEKKERTTKIKISTNEYDVQVKG